MTNYKGKNTAILEENIRIIIGLNNNFELFIRDISRGEEVELCRADTEKLLDLLKAKEKITKTGKVLS